MNHEHTICPDLLAIRWADAEYCSDENVLERGDQKQYCVLKVDGL